MPRLLALPLGLVIVGVASLLISGDPPPDATRKAPAGIPRELLEQRLEAARNVFEKDLKRLQGAQLTIDERLLWWSERWLNAQLALSEKPAERTAALEAHVQRVKEVERIFVAYAKSGQGRDSDAAAATYFRAEAEIRLIEAGGK